MILAPRFQSLHLVSPVIDVCITDGTPDRVFRSPFLCQISSRSAAMNFSGPSSCGGWRPEAVAKNGTTKPQILEQETLRGRLVRAPGGSDLKTTRCRPFRAPSRGVMVTAVPTWERCSLVNGYPPLSPAMAQNRGTYRSCPVVLHWLLHPQISPPVRFPARNFICSALFNSYPLLHLIHNQDKTLVDKKATEATDARQEKTGKITLGGCCECGSVPCAFPGRL